MKRIILLLAATVVALLAGVAVFLWSGESPSDLEERGRQLQESIHEAGRMGQKGVEQARELIRHANIPSPGAQTPKKKPDQTGSVQEPPTRRETPSTPQPPATPTAPLGPPMEDISTKDREKLKGILGD